MTAPADSWVSAPLSEVAAFDIGRTPARANASYWRDDGETVPWVAISDMRPYEAVTGTAERISGTALRDVFRQRVVPAGTLLMSFKLTIGRVAFLAVPACHNEAIVSIFPRDGVDPRYLAYYLSQLDYAAHHDRQIKGNTLNRAKLERMPVQLPSSMEEQRGIADVLDEVRRAIRVEAASSAASEDLKRAAMQHLFSGGCQDAPAKETQLGPVPASWVVEVIDDRYSVASGSTPSRMNPAFWEDGTIPWVKTAEVRYTTIYDTSERIAQHAVDTGGARVFPAGTLLLAMYGQGVTRGKVGMLGVPAACNQACAAMTPKDRRLAPRFLYHFLAWRYEAIRGLAHGGQQQNLNLDIVRALPIAYPPELDEQAAIVAFLDVIDRKVAIHRQRHDLLEQLFVELLHQLMSQAIRVHDLDLSRLTAGEGSKERAGAPA
jgi:type I restriction enzyme S subunit